jgi:uncharacterized protein (TIGR03086 family)
MDAAAGLLYRDALAAAREMLSGIGDRDLARPTPCTGWDLRALVAHMLGQNRGFAAAIGSGDAAAGEYAAPPVHDAAALQRAWDESVARLIAACAAADPDRRIRLVEISTEATFPTAGAVRIQLLDTVVHTWDVAVGLGLGHRPTPELLELVAAIARAIPDGPNRTLPGAAFQPALQAPGSDPWTATLARLGRRPGG